MYKSYQPQGKKLHIISPTHESWLKEGLLKAGILFKFITDKREAKEVLESPFAKNILLDLSNTHTPSSTFLEQILADENNKKHKIFLIVDGDFNVETLSILQESLPSLRLVEKGLLQDEAMLLSLSGRSGFEADTLGGAFYIRMADAEHYSFLSSHIDDKNYSITKEAINNNASKKQKHHIYRVSFVFLRLIEALEDTENLEHLLPLISVGYAIPGLLEFTPEAGGSCSLLDSSERQFELAKVLQANSRALADLEMPVELQRVTAKMADILQKNSLLTHSVEDRVATLLVLCQLFDHECFRYERFSGYHGYRFLSWLKTMTYSLRGTQEYLSAFSRFLAEGLLHTRGEMKYNSLSTTSRRKSGTSFLSVDKLRTGMRVEEDIISTTGRVVLSENTILDQDLIQRIWRLSALTNISELPVNKEQYPQ